MQSTAVWRNWSLHWGWKMKFGILWSLSALIFLGTQFQGRENGFGNEPEEPIQPVSSNAYHVRLEQLEGRIEELEDTVWRLQEEPARFSSPVQDMPRPRLPRTAMVPVSGGGGREYVFQSPEGCEMWVEYNQVFFIRWNKQQD